jgi:hypothetical protein
MRKARHSFFMGSFTNLSIFNSSAFTSAAKKQRWFVFNSSHAAIIHEAHNTGEPRARAAAFSCIFYRRCRNEFGAPEMCVCFSLSATGVVGWFSKSRLSYGDKALFINTNSKSVSLTALHRARFYTQNTGGFLSAGEFNCRLRVCSATNCARPRHFANGTL